MTELPKMSAQEVARRMEAGTIRLVDIREPEEVAALRVPGATVAPLSVIRWQDFRPVTDKPVVFTCNSPFLVFNPNQAPISIIPKKGIQRNKVVMP